MAPLLAILLALIQLGILRCLTIITLEKNTRKNFPLEQKTDNYTDRPRAIATIAIARVLHHGLMARTSFLLQ